ncbi:cytosolic arginine sensor for mTORC1 subunit 1 isoform X1 [Scophthalmus maximus]|uniref:cytosolic arginine sensor for mTORC1 subunit 1 isoform X1 n=1 Tax=Scophthalmus maximus TaxID=52904 RepID=UPI001FA81F4E|nr:cytosolic arginine sensor for mTORC1 subunit 1 isoform X1 [Scophthalmus maximus]
MRRVGCRKAFFLSRTHTHTHTHSLCTDPRSTNMDLHILDHRLRVTSISKDGLVNFTHPLIKLIFLRNRTRCKFFSLTETPENYTVVLDEEGFKELQPSEHLKVESSIWLPLNVVSNGNASSSSQAVGVTKIAKSVIAPLAQQHVSVFMLSTYQTDFILVREKDLSVVVSTLEEEFNIYKESGGESVPVHCQDVSGGLQKNGKEALQPTVHPVLIPQNHFCVMSLDPDTLPSIATTLIDVLFYSSSPKEEPPSSPSPDLDCIKFFSFSLIDGYISLVMDTEAQRRRVRHSRPDIPAPRRQRHLRLLHQHLQLRPRSGSRGGHSERDGHAAASEKGSSHQLIPEIPFELRPPPSHSITLPRLLQHQLHAVAMRGGGGDD